MADMGGFNVPTPQEILAQLAQKRQQVMVAGNVQQQRNQNIETALDTVFGNPQLRLAKTLQQRVQAAEQSVAPMEGESDLDREMRRLVAIRDGVADISPDTASQVTTQLLKLGQMRLEQNKLSAQEARETEDQDWERQLHPLNIEAKQVEIASKRAEGQNYWRSVNGRIERQNVSVLDSLDRARLRAEGWTEGTGPGTEAEASSALGLTKPVTTDLQTTLLNAQNELDGLKNISQSYDPDFLTWGSQIANWSRAAIEKTGATLPPAQAAKLQKFAEFRSNSMDTLNRVIHAMSGTAVSASELQRMLKAYPNAENDSPGQFMAKLRNKVRDVMAVQKRAQQALSSGLKVSGDQWNGISMPPVTDAEVDAFMQNQFGVPAKNAPAPAAGGVIDRFRTKPAK